MLTVLIVEWEFTTVSLQKMQESNVAQVMLLTILNTECPTVTCPPPPSSILAIPALTTMASYCIECLSHTGYCLGVVVTHAVVKALAAQARDMFATVDFPLFLYSFDICT